MINRTQVIKKRSNTKSTILKVKQFINKQNVLIKKLEKLSHNLISDSRNTIMGIEGNLSKNYFQTLQIILPKNYQFKKRSRRPGLDYFNATLNYLYGMTYSQIEHSLFAIGLDPFIGILHTNNYNKQSLVFDMIEIFRPIIDRLLIEMCIKNELENNHFKAYKSGFWLSKAGKQFIIPAFNDYLHERIKINNRVSTLQNHFLINAQNLVTAIKTPTYDIPHIL